MGPLVYYCRWRGAKLRLHGRDEDAVWGELITREGGAERAEPFRFDLLSWEDVYKRQAQETAEIARFQDNAREYRNATVAQGREEAKFLPLLLLGVTEAIGFAHALLLLQAGRIQVGDVVAYIGLLGLFGFPTNISLMAYSRVSLGLAGARRILELMNRETLLDENPVGHAETITGDVTFDGVSFGYCLLYTSATAGVPDALRHPLRLSDGRVVSRHRARRAAAGDV